MSATPAVPRPFGARVYAWLLRLYPQSIYDAQADDMLDLFTDMFANKWSDRGRAAARLFAIGACLEIPLQAMLARRTPVTRRESVPAEPQPRRKEELMATIAQDIRYAFRSLGKSVGFTAVSVVTLALGIGANTAIFSVVNAVLLRPLPFDRPDELALLWTNNPTEGQERYFVSPRDFNDWRSFNQTFQELGAVWRTEVTVTDGENDPARFKTGWSTENLFSLVGVSPHVGRLFGPDDGPGSQLVAVLSYGLWQRHYGGDPNVIGKTITANSSPATIVGVLPNQMAFPNDAEFWLNMNWPMEIQGRGARWMNAIGRLKPGVTIDNARADMTRIAQRLASDYPADVGWGITMESLRDTLVGDTRRALLVLLGATGFILLIACANVANLMLSRSEARNREIAVRSALGAGRKRIVRQLMTESLVLAALGSAAGVALAIVGIKGLVALGPANLPRLGEVSIDGRVMALVLASTGLTGVVFGLAPVARLLRVDVQESLREGSKGTTSADRMRVRGSFVVAQFALALVLVICAGLLIKSFAKLRSTDPGFNAGGVLTMEVNLPGGPYPGYPQVARFYRDFTDRLEVLPGIQSVSLASTLPLGESLDYYSNFQIVGREPPRDGEDNRAYFRQVDPEFFATMGVPLVRGRHFTDDDHADAPGVVIINDAMAKRYWADEDPIGERIYDVADQYGPLGAMLIDEVEVVGVVSDVKYGGLKLDSEASLYFPHQQAPFRRMTVAVRTSGEPSTIVPVVRSELQSMDPDLPIANVSTMNQVLSESIAQDQFTMLLLGLFGGVALLLASVGIYGVLAYNVQQRTNEVGIRMALGANTGNVLRLVLRNGAQLVGIGLVIGLAGAFGVTRLLSTQLYGVSSTDPIIFGSVVLLLSIVALVASIVPAWRATNVDPLVALRYD